MTHHVLSGVVILLLPVLLGVWWFFFIELPHQPIYQFAVTQMDLDHSVRVAYNRLTLGKERAYHERHQKFLYIVETFYHFFFI